MAKTSPSAAPGRLTPDDLVSRTRIFEVDELHLWDANPNRGDADAIAASMEEFGQVQTLLVATDGQGRKLVIDGNHRVDDERRHRRFGGRLAGVDITGLDWNEVRSIAAGLALNRTSRLGRDDDVLLAEVLQRIQDEDDRLLHAMGYTPEDLDDLLRLTAVDMPNLDDLAGDEGDDDPTVVRIVFAVPAALGETWRERQAELGADDRERFEALLRGVGLLDESDQ